MLQTLLCKSFQGQQYIKNLRKAAPSDKFRGFPILSSDECSGCGDCVKICPARAIEISPLSVDLGRCILCGDCEAICPAKAIHFSSAHKLAADTREKLVISGEESYEKFYEKAVELSRKYKKLFGNSLKLRQVSAGGCNGCEMELGACGNVNFDMGRFGIEFTASPRHADGIVITGPLTENMAYALEETYTSIPDPKIIILTGACAIDKGVFHESESLKRDFTEKFKPDLYIPGCPPHPLTFICGVMDFLGIK